MYDILTIGGGPAGLTAAIYGARAGLSVAVVEKAVPGGQITSTHQLENYPGFSQGISGAEFSQQLLEQAKRVGAQVLTDEILSLQLEGKVKKAEGKAGSYQAKTMVLALGAAPRKLEIPGEQQFTGMGVSYCATCDGAFFKGRTVAVVGGGDVAVEDALFLARGCEKVYLIHRRDELRAAASLQEQLKKCGNVEFLWDTEVVSISGEDHVDCLKIRSKKSGEEKVLDIDGVFIAVGKIPNTGIITELLHLETNGYICATEDGKTEIPGIFAAGDIRTKQLRQIVTAVSDGANVITSVQGYLNSNN